MYEVINGSIILIFILIVILVAVRLYYLLDKSNDKLINTTTIISFSRFSKECPGKCDNICFEHAMRLSCTKDICSNYHFYKINQTNKRFNLN